MVDGFEDAVRKLVGFHAFEDVHQRVQFRVQFGGWSRARLGLGRGSVSRRNADFRLPAVCRIPKYAEFCTQPVESIHFLPRFFGIVTGSPGSPSAVPSAGWKTPLWRYIDRSCLFHDVPVYLRINIARNPLLTRRSGGRARTQSRLYAHPAGIPRPAAEPPSRKRLQHQAQASRFRIMPKSQGGKSAESTGYGKNSAQLGMRHIANCRIRHTWHAAQHFKEALDSAYGENSPLAQHHFERLREILKDEQNGIDRVLRSRQRLARRHPQRTAISRVLHFFRKQQNRVRYAEFQQRGHLIGSGIVEAANRVLIAKRLKCSGMRRSKNGTGQVILSLRALWKSGSPAATMPLGRKSCAP